MNVIVFGATGQAGRELMALASRRGLPFRGFNRAEADITDEESVRRAFAATRPGAVVNCAAYTAVDRAEAEPLLADKVNAEGAAIVARACAASGIPLIHLSTDYVFDGRKAGPYTEDDAVAPINIYGKSKERGEREVRAAHGNHVILRTSWVYGIYGTNFLKTILRLAGERDELRIVADQQGCPTSTADIAEAIVSVVRALGDKRAIAGTYHFAGTGCTSWYEFAHAIVERQHRFTGRSPGIIPIPTSEYPTAAQRPMNSQLDSSKFSAAFGYAAKSWRERVAEAVDALLGGDTRSRAIS